MTGLRIVQDDLQGERIRAFLREHLDDMHGITPPESVHALDLDGLRVPEVTFWTAWSGSDLLGCGALKELDPRRGEVKSMRTARAHRGRGVGSQILAHLVAVAEGRGYERLLLETGAMPEFEPARVLYLRHGFRFRGPFPPYAEDPNSVFMERRLATG